MQIINPKVELIEQGENIVSHVARCARVCYKREKGNDEVTYNNLIENKHWSMFRHATFYFIIPRNKVPDWIRYYYTAIQNEANIIGIDIKFDYDYYYVVTNGNWNLDHQRLIDTIIDYKVEDKEFNNYYFTRIMMRYTFKIITQISTSRELNRVSPNNIAEQSTRYVGFITKQSIYDYDLKTEQGIIDAYLAGYSPKQIDIHCQLSHHKIRKLLIDNGIELRPTGNMVNHHAFNNIDCAEKAYLLGLIESDGNIRSSHNELNITQHKDYYLYVKAIMNYVLKDVKETNDRNCKRLYCFSNEIINDLKNIGIVENKTYNQTNKDIEKLINAIPKPFYSSFIRGLFDGDGSIGFYKDKNGYDNINFCIAVHTEQLRDFVINIIKDIINKEYIRVSNRNNLYYIELHAKEDIIAFGKFLYTDFKYPFGHPNKTNKYITFLQDNNVNINYNFPIADFGDNKFVIVAPHWLKSCSNPAIIFTYLFSIYNSELAYKNLIDDKKPRQDARGVLPLDTATECVYTYSIPEWRHIIELRADVKHAHPNAVIIANMIKKELNYLGYDL